MPCPNALCLVPADNPEIVIEACRSNAGALKFATERLGGDKDFILHLFSLVGCICVCFAISSSRFCARECPDALGHQSLTVAA